MQLFSNISQHCTALRPKRMNQRDFDRGMFISLLVVYAISASFFIFLRNTTVALNVSKQNLKHIILG